MTKNSLALLVSVLLVGSLSACSKSEPEQPKEEAAKVETQAEAPAETAAAPAEPTPEPAAPTGAFASPESVVIHGDKLYTSNVGAQLNPTEKDADGFILITGTDGNEEGAEKFEVDAYLHAPKGMMVWNDSLYVTDVNYIYGFDLNDNSLVFAVEPGLQHPDEAQPLFLNDLTPENENSFFVSATDTNVIYRITNDFVPAIFKLEIDGELKGPNGLQYDAENKKLYVAGWGTEKQNNGELGVVDMSAKPHKYTRLGDHSGHLDGLLKVGDKLIFSDWVKLEKAGHIYSYDLSSGETKQLTKDAIAGPADFNLSADGNSLIVPAMIGNEILTIPLS